MSKTYLQFNPSAPFDKCIRQIVELSEFYYRLGNRIKRLENPALYETAEQLSVPSEELTAAQKLAKNIMFKTTKPQLKMNAEFLEDLSQFAKKIEEFLLKVEGSFSEEDAKAVKKAVVMLNFQLSTFPADADAMKQLFVLSPEVFDGKMNRTLGSLPPMVEAFDKVRKEAKLGGGSEISHEAPASSPTAAALKNARENPEPVAERIVPSFGPRV